MDSPRPIVQDGQKGVLLTVYVQPKASRTECVGVYGDALKIRVAAPAVKGAANEALIRFIADRCAIPRAAVLIDSGVERRHKRLCLEGISAQLAMARLIQEA